jgi:hypothetical protein
MADFEVRIPVTEKSTPELVAVQITTLLKLAHGSRPQAPLEKEASFLAHPATAKPGQVIVCAFRETHREMLR